MQNAAAIDEQRRRAALIGFDPETAPASLAELDAYYDRIRPSLYACQEAKEALRMLSHPPVPDGNRVLKLALPPVNALAFATLPGWARRMYGRPGSPVTDIVATTGLRAVRLAFGRQRLFLAAMRAVHRAEWAGENLKAR